MTKIGFVGSGKYKNKRAVINKLFLIDLEQDIIVSGHSPRNKYDNVDIWAEEWAKKWCVIPPIIHPAKEFTRDGFFARNKLIAKDSNILCCFINKGQYKSGTWNTVKHFLKKGDMLYTIDWLVYDENERLWDYEELPKWTLRERRENLQ